MIDQDDAHDFIIKASEHVSKSLWGFVENRLHEKYPDAALASKNDTSLPSLIKQVAMKELANFFFENGESLASKNQSLLFALDNDFDSEEILERAYSRSNTENFSRHGNNLSAVEVFLSTSKRSPLQAATPEDRASAKDFFEKSIARTKENYTKAFDNYRKHERSADEVIFRKLSETHDKMKQVAAMESFRVMTFNCLEQEIQKELQKVINIVKQTNAPLLTVHQVPIHSDQSERTQTHSSPSPLSRATFDETRQNKTPTDQKTLAP